MWLRRECVCVCKTISSSLSPQQCSQIYEVLMRPAVVNVKQFHNCSAELKSSADLRFWCWQSAPWVALRRHKNSPNKFVQIIELLLSFTSNTSIRFQDFLLCNIQQKTKKKIYRAGECRMWFPERDVLQKEIFFLVDDFRAFNCLLGVHFLQCCSTRKPSSVSYSHKHTHTHSHPASPDPTGPPCRIQLSGQGWDPVYVAASLLNYCHN